MSPQKQSKFQSALVSERHTGTPFCEYTNVAEQDRKEVDQQSADGRHTSFLGIVQDVCLCVYIREEEEKTPPSSLMKLKSSQTTRGNEKKKPPFLAFHFLSSLSSTRGVKATQEERAGGPWRARRMTAWQHSSWGRRG